MGEGKPYTYLSFAQLLLAGGLSGWIFWLRHKQVKLTSGIKSLHWIWLIMAAGFVFLAVDEVTQFHENLNKWILVWFSLEKNNITNRIDDVIVGLYVLVGLGMVIINRREFIPYKGALKFLFVGIAIALVHVLFDLMGHHTDFVRMIIKEQSLIMPVYQWMQAIEEILKVLAEGVIVAAFYYCLTLTIGTPRSNSDTEATLQA